MRLRLRYSLRTFIVVIVALTAALGISTARVIEQRRHARVLHGAGLDVIYDIDAARQLSALSRVRKWATQYVERDWISWPVEINGHGDWVDGEIIHSIVALRNIRRVDLAYTVTDDEALRKIARLPRLEVLKLGDTLVTEKGLTYLSSCSALRELELGDSLAAPSAISAFAKKKPHCQVNYTGPRSPQSVERQRFEYLQADRIPSAEEARELAAAIGILEARDNATRHNFAQQLVSSDQRLAPLDPNNPNFGLWNTQFQRWLKSRPPDDWDDLAIDRLGELGLSAAIPALERVARDTSRSEAKGCRCRAIRSLSHIADRRVVPVLIDLLEDRSDNVAMTAWQQLILATGQRFGEDQGWDADRESEFRRTLPGLWREYWKGQGDVIKLRRYATFEYFGY